MRAIRLVSCSCPVPEVPAAKGIPIELPKTEPILGTQFPIEAVSKTVWLPEQQGSCVDDGSFFHLIQNDGVTITAEWTPSASVPLPLGCARVEAITGTTTIPLKYNTNRSTIFEDENGVVYSLPERAPPVFKETLNVPTTPVLCPPPPTSVLCRASTKIPHTITKVQSVWLSRQSAWVNT